MGTVWLVNNLDHLDLSAAHQHGTLRIINDRYVFGDELREDLTLPGVVQARLRGAAKSFDPKADFVMLAGDLLQIGQFLIMLARVHPGEQIWVLRHSRNIKGYFQVALGGLQPGDAPAQQNTQGLSTTYDRARNP